MEVLKLIELKQKLEYDVLKLIYDFEKDTDVYVSDLHIVSIAGGQPTIVGVKVEVNLEGQLEGVVMKTTEVLTREEYNAVQAGGLKKWGVEGALAQTKGSFEDWWDSKGSDPCSFCVNFHSSKELCKNCILWDEKAGECFDEYQEVKEAVEDNDFPAFHKAATDVHVKILEADYEAYLRFVGVDKKESGAWLMTFRQMASRLNEFAATVKEASIQPEPKKPEPEYPVDMILYWDGTDGRGCNWDGEQLVRIISPVSLFNYRVRSLKDGRQWGCDSPALRPATDDEIAEYFTVTLDGVRCRFYEDKDEDIFHIRKGDFRGYVGVGDIENPKIAKAFLEKAGVPVMSFADSKGDYRLPKE